MEHDGTYGKQGTKKNLPIAALLPVYSSPSPTGGTNWSEKPWVPPKMDQHGLRKVLVTASQLDFLPSWLH